MIDFLTTSMLRMRSAERLSAGACLTKGYDLGLFCGYSPDFGSVTPTQRMALPSSINDDDDSTTIILDALWDTEEGNSKHHTDIRTGRSDPGPTLGLLAPSSPSKGDGHDSRQVQTPAELEYHKRQRSPVVDLSNNDRFKRRALEAHPIDVPNLHALTTDRSQSCTVKRIDCPLSRSISQQCGLTYPSALRDCIKISDCSIPELPSALRDCTKIPELA